MQIRLAGARATLFATLFALGACTAEPSDTTQTETDSGAGTAASTTSQGTDTTGTAGTASTTEPDTTGGPAPTSSSTTGTTTGSTTDATASSTQGIDCEPGEMVPCYDGPPQTEGVGVCVAGVAECDQNGEPGACEGAVTPAADDLCHTPLDEDCDGEALTCTGSQIWARMVGNVGQDPVGRAAFAPDGEVVVVGTMSGNLFEPDEGVEIWSGVFGNDGEVFYGRYSADGDYLHGAVHGGEGSQYATDASVDADGNTIVVGLFNDPTDFGDGPGAFDGAFILKLDHEGELLWSRQFGPDANFLRVVTDHANGGFIAVGEYSGDTFDLGGGPLPPQVVDNEFMARFDDDGELVWTNAGFARINNFDLAIGPEGQIGMAGSYYLGTLTLDGQTIGSDTTGVFTAVFTPDGALDIANVEGGSHTAELYLAFGPDGEMWLTGDQTSWPPGAPKEGFDSLEDGVFLAHFAPDGEFLGYRDFLGPVEPKDIAVGPGGAPVTIGIYEDGGDVGTGPLASTGRFIYSGKYDDTPDPVWVNLGTTDTMWWLDISQVVVGTDGRVLLSGTIGGTTNVDFGYGPTSGLSTADDAYLGVFSP